MVPKTQWTIQDYFQHAGQALDPARLKNMATGLSSASDEDFARILADTQMNAQPSASGSNKGRRIAEYLKMPVHAKLPRPMGPTPPSPPSVAQVNVPSRSAYSAQRNAMQIPAVEIPSSEAIPFADVPLIAPQLPEPEPADTVARRIDQGIEKAAAAYNLPPGLIRSVIRAESNFQVAAQSPAGAQGLMQLMPATAKELGVNDPFDIDQNIDGGARYLRQMLDRFGGDLKQALAAYNAGPGAVMKYDGQVPYRETRDYVRKVMLYAQR